ncbi:MULTISPECIES: bifunctional phosphopantothenoylcysteine decarboxylase/phosphopantothenate--cysteine ligase CoaBC [unclassified Synechococcus]|uniref:bifunctional phosphopantothenoylcysteine decarboxylase/phosphopantothenate--cysteine ligase CoaBC n=1 Tax=unclassified Synechococcus TaxID=2626047 RepID=UPI001CF88F60|nr:MULTISPECIES: bifunctional phosphopantothenoylcysteine decarboxylase/phosphopantothenate--cysteine ligase CoaBC [unclassified Synechococcus]MCB4411921.1 bifunctional phosphopantothenoylcysteine decarboxylase/phosphopantothenate--cysteine ligase CoaBC [Synechococcus sp. MU1611]
MRTDKASSLYGRRVLVAVSGSIAAVKTPLLVSALVKAGAEVRCLVTPSGAALVSPVALASLSRHRCYLEADQWNPTAPRPLHIELAEWAELAIVAPLSASSLARWSQGSADGLLASVLLATEGPVIAAPAMNTAMWRHPAVQRNWLQIQDFQGVVPLLPMSGLLACDRVGDGRMADPTLIQLAAESVFSRGPDAPVATCDWSGISLLVSAGPTQETIDAARFLSNRSSGRMGVLMAQAARFRGATVQLVHGPLDLPDAWLEGLQCTPVESAAQLSSELQLALPTSDVLVMAAAVADLRREAGFEEKMPKKQLQDVLSSGWTEVPDLLSNLTRQRRPGQLVLGFSALTGDDTHLLEKAESKRLQKGCDLMMVNPVDRDGQGFGDQPNGGWLLGEGWNRNLPVTTKLTLAHQLLDALFKLRDQAAALVDS